MVLPVKTESFLTHQPFAPDIGSLPAAVHPQRKQAFIVRKEKCKIIGVVRRVYKPDCDTIFIRSIQI
jgi:hypothetical protein